MARIFTDNGGQVLASAAQKLTMLDTFSVAFWLYRTATPAATADLIDSLGATDGWHISLLLTTNLIAAGLRAGTTDKVRNSATAPALNTWVHVVVTHENRGLTSTDFLFYFNGKQEAGTDSSTMSGTHSNAAQPFTVGVNASAWNRTAPARIGPIAIWSRALSATESLALAGGAHPLRFKEGLVEMFEMLTAHGELGLISNIYLAQSATNPTSAAVNPPLEPIPSSLYVNRQNYQTRRARYGDNGVVGARSKVHRLSQAVKRSAYY